MIEVDKMPSIYTKADLLWEATRRNEEYKGDFSAMLNKYRSESKTKEIQSHKYLPYISSDRWGISIIREDGDKIKIFGWLDPTTEIDEIKREIHSGAVPVAIHPYAYIHELERTNPNIYYYQGLQQGENPYFSELDISGNTYVCIKKGIVRNRIVGLIDPTAGDKAIAKGVKEIKDKVLENIKTQTDALKKSGEIVCYPRDINKYIGWLKKYDGIVDYLKKKPGDEHFTIENGVVMLRKDFSFAKVVPNDTPGDKFEGQRKAYKEAHEGAVKLIQASPNIIFSAPKVQTRKSE